MGAARGVVGVVQDDEAGPGTDARAEMIDVEVKASFSIRGTGTGTPPMYRIIDS